MSQREKGEVISGGQFHVENSLRGQYNKHSPARELP